MFSQLNQFIGSEEYIIYIFILLVIFKFLFPKTSCFEEKENEKPQQLYKTYKRKQTRSGKYY